jgi:GNAT superfamily N-acetyltransferase
VLIRRATPDDIPHIRRLEQGSDTAAHWSPSQYDALFLPDGPARISLVAAEEFAELPIMGFLIVRCLPEEWEIENIVVDQRGRRRGIGSSLVRQLLAEAWPQSFWKFANPTVQPYNSMKTLDLDKKAAGDTIIKIHRKTLFCFASCCNPVTKLLEAEKDVC